MNKYFIGFHRVALSSTFSRLNWTLGMLVFVEEGKLGCLKKNPWSKDENQQQTQLLTHILLGSTLGIERGPN